MLRTKPYCRARCAESLRTAGVHADLIMDRKERGNYMGLFYERSRDRYWITRNFLDVAKNECIVSKLFIHPSQEIHNLPIDNCCTMQ